MDLSNLPIGVAVILQSVSSELNLQHLPGSKTAHCQTDNRDIYEQLILHRVRDDKIAIQSVHSGRFMQVRTSGECVFDPTKPGEWELFSMETDSSGALYFVSCHTGNVLQCDEDKVAKCDNQNWEDDEAWRIVEPRSTAGGITSQMQRILDQRYILTGKDRQNMVIELARCGKTPEEIEQIVTSNFDSPAATAPHSAFAVSVTKE